jgi:hypothetical protein
VENKSESQKINEYFERMEKMIETLNYEELVEYFADKGIEIVKIEEE